jgi:predicted nucleic acid-binding Zn ribbon protein
MKLAEYKEFFPARHCQHCQQWFVAARSDAKTCSDKCRMALSRRKRNPTPCFQKIKRDEEARASPRPQDTVTDYRIEAISAREAADFIKRYEFLGTVGRSLARYGARNAKGELVAVAVFGHPSKFSDNSVICLERGACTPWAHRCTASWFIPRAVKMAAADHGWKIFFAYADPACGEIGTVYQACNWLYTGQTPTRTVNGAPRPRDYFTDGKVTISDKAFYKRGHSMDDVKSGAWRRVPKPAKHRYVWIEAPTRRGRRALAARFTALPYPKR